MREPSKLEAKFAWHLQVHGLPAPVPEYRFHATRRWRFDFAWPDLMLAVEIDGGEWCAKGYGGRHNRTEGIRNDREKAIAADRLGWEVLHYTGAEVTSGKAIASFERTLNSRTPRDVSESSRGATPSTATLAKGNTSSTDRTP